MSGLEIFRHADRTDSPYRYRCSPRRDRRGARRAACRARRRARPRRHLPIRGDRRAQDGRLFRRTHPDRARRPGRIQHPRPRSRVQPPGSRRRLGRDRGEHAPGRGAQHGPPPPGRGRRRSRATSPRLCRLTRADRPRRRGAGRRDQRARAGPHATRARSPPGPAPAGGSTVARCSARCPPPPPTCMWPSPTSTRRASSAMRTRWCPPARPG